MKIIFDSKEQEDELIRILANSNACPSGWRSIFNLHDHPYCGEGRITCEECWRSSGLAIEIKEVSE